MTAPTPGPTFDFLDDRADQPGGSPGIAPGPDGPDGPLGPLGPTGSGPVPGSGRGALWLALGGTLALLIVAYGCLVLVNLLARETSNQTLDLADLGDLSQVERIRIDISSGSVRITGAEGHDGVTGELRVQRDLWSPEHRARLDGDTLVLETDCPVFGTLFCGVDYELTVPLDLAVDIDSSGGGLTVIGATAPLDLRSSGGGIVVRDATGPITVDSSGGGIEVIDSGDVEASSSGGSVRISGSTADRAVVSSSGGGVTIDFSQPPSDVRADSSGGGVTVRLPNDPDIAYDVDTSASGGSTNVEVRTDPTAGRTIAAHSSGGSVDVVYDDGQTG